MTQLTHRHDVSEERDNESGEEGLEEDAVDAGDARRRGEAGTREVWGDRADDLESEKTQGRVAKGGDSIAA